MHLRLVGASWCGCVNPHTGAESGGVHSSQCVPVGTPDGGGVCQSAHRTRALTVPMVRVCQSAHPGSLRADSPRRSHPPTHPRSGCIA
jgi:hypothetical protein